MLLVTLGDLLLDVVVRLSQPLAPGADVVAVTHVGPGGQAANVAAWAAALGAEARFIGKRGDDEAGALAAAGLAARDVEACGPVVPGRTGVVVSLVAPDGDRTMASDRGVAPELAAGDLDPAWLAGCDHLHLSGYSLLRSPIAGAALRAVELARAGGARVSVDLSAWPLIRDFGPPVFRARLEELAPDVVFANGDEERVLGGPLAGVEWVLKLGPRGARFDGVELPAPPVEVIDSTGAGDALAAGHLVGGPALAVATAARCVAKMGAMP